MAIPSTTVWEVQTGGTDTNGGAYSSGGTDYSLVTTKRTATGSNDSTTDGVANNTTTFTSATAAFTSALIGNIIYLQGGTGSLAATRRHVVSVTNATTIVLDASVATGTGITMNIGGCLASLGESGRNKTGGNTIWIKAGSYSITSATANVSGGCWSLNDVFYIEGYQTTRGDLGTKPVLTASGITNFIMISTTGGNGGKSLIRNLTLDGASLTTGRGISSFGSVESITFQNFAGVYAFNDGGGAAIANCTFTGCTGNNTILIASGRMIGCLIYGNTNASVCITVSSYSSLFNCVAYNNTTGATVGAFQMNGEDILFVNCVAVNNSAYGFRNTSSSQTGRYIGCIAQGNGNIGFSFQSNPSNVQLVNCAGYNNTSGDVSSLGTGVFVSNTGFVTGTATFFVDVATLDFRLSSNSSGLAARGTGYPGVSAVGTGYADIGALQSLASAGGGERSAVF